MSLVRIGVRPNVISAASVGACIPAGVAMLATSTAEPFPAALLYVAAGACIQLRLLCNLFDGLVAVEGGRGSRAGGMWNELPDRFSDGICLVCAGVAGGAPTLGWLAAFLAAVTAYVRTLGASLGASHSFAGPMAKQHRMAALTAGMVLAAAESVLGRPHRAIRWVLVAIIVGSALTVVRRVRAIERDLR
jgi:phosphatidylglycerophosphate synthase